MGAAFYMPCPLKQWFSTCHCPYGLPRLWDPLPLPYIEAAVGVISKCFQWTWHVRWRVTSTSVDDDHLLHHC